MFEGQKDKIEEVANKQQEAKKLTKIRSIRPQRGHTLYKVHKKTLDLSIADFIKEDANYEDIINGRKPKRKVKVDDSFMYVSALNKKNAKKKMLKLGFKINI